MLIILNNKILWKNCEVNYTPLVVHSVNKISASLNKEKRENAKKIQIIMYIRTILDSVSSKVQNTFNNNQIGYDSYDFDRWNDEKIKPIQKRKFIKNEKEKRINASEIFQ